MVEGVAEIERHGWRVAARETGPNGIRTPPFEPLRGARHPVPRSGRAGAGVARGALAAAPVVVTLRRHTPTPKPHPEPGRSFRRRATRPAGIGARRRVLRRRSGLGRPGSCCRQTQPGSRRRATCRRRRTGRIRLRRRPRRQPTGRRPPLTAAAVPASAIRPRRAHPSRSRRSFPRGASSRVDARMAPTGRPGRPIYWPLRGDRKRTGSWRGRTNRSRNRGSRRRGG